MPELAYAPIKNEKHQICVAGRTARKVQTGYFERMLCPQCEALLSGYESEFKRIWMDTIPPDFVHLRTAPMQDVISVAVPDYSAFKLFHLSVFWRAAVSKGFTLGKFSLGPYEIELARAIRERDPGTPGNFPFLGVLILDGAGRPVPTVTPLAKGKDRLDGHHYYMMSYAYCEWTFIVAQPGPRWLSDLEVDCRTRGEFPLLTVRYDESKSFRLWAAVIRGLRK